MKNSTLFLIILVSTVYRGFAQQSLTHPKVKIKIAFLGTYHFANPGQDKFNVNVDDYNSDKRQKEIEDLNNSLAKFNPEKIFTESGVKYQDEADKYYQGYKSGKLPFPKNAVNEKYQIGFKLAKQLGNEHFYCVDADGNWFENKVKRYADSAGLGYYKEFEKSTQDHIAYMNTYFATHTVKQNLALFNKEEEQLNHNHYMYNYVFPRVGAGDTYVGADLVGEWYKRNLKIYSNILKFIETMKDKRVLVVFGNGHMHILKQLFKDNPDFEVVDINKYLK